MQSEVATEPGVTYIAQPLARDALRLYLGEAANILPIPTDDAGCDFLREQAAGHTLVLVPLSDRDRTAQSAASMLRHAGLQCMISPISAEWFLSATLPPGRLEKLLLGAPRETSGHVVLNLTEFFEQPIPDAVQLLGPIHEADVGFLAAWRGTGKTLFNLSLAVAVSGGLPFLGWQCPAPRPVLYIDGEMPFALMRAHLQTVLETFKHHKGEFDPNNLRIVTPDVQPDGLEPDLSTKSGRQRMDDVIGDAVFVVLDNLSALVGGDAENDSDVFEPVRRYQKSLRRRNVANLLTHHAGKGGDQRGHSGKEDLVDFSALLEPAAERSEATGAKFRLRWKKVRRDLPFLRELDIELIRGNPPEWHYQTIGEAIDQIVQRLAEEGHAVREIVNILREDHGIRKSKNTVAQMVRK